MWKKSPSWGESCLSLGLTRLKALIRYITNISSSTSLLFIRTPQISVDRSCLINCLIRHTLIEYLLFTRKIVWSPKFNDLSISLGSSMQACSVCHPQRWGKSPTSPQPTIMPFVLYEVYPDWGLPSFAAHHAALLMILYHLLLIFNLPF